MVVQLAAKFTSDLVTAGTLTTIRRTVNRETGQYIVDKILPSKFTESIKYDIPHVYQRRGQKYEARKRRRLGHATPWVYTGNAKRTIPQTARITATSNGGRVIVRAPWAGKAKTKKDGGFAKQGFQEFQRQELEAVGKRQLERLAARQQKVFTREINDPKNRRKRSLRKKKV